MNRHVNAIAGRLSLRAPQRHSLEILDRVTEIVPPRKSADLSAALAVIRGEYATVQEYFFHDMEGARFVLGDSHREDAAGFLRPLAVPAGAEREARNRWRWFTDSADAVGFKCAARLKENFASRQG